MRASTVTKHPWWVPLFALITYGLTLAAIATVGQSAWPSAWELVHPVLGPCILIAFVLGVSRRTAFALHRVAPTQLAIGLLSGVFLYAVAAITKADLSGDLPRASIVAAIAIAPMAEEGFYRGYLLPALVSRFGSVAALVLSSALFAVLHGPDLHHVALALVAGWTFGSLFVATGSLVPSLVAHSLYNALVVFL